MPSLLLAVVIAGAVGLFLALPRGRASAGRIGSLALAVAGALLLALLARRLGSDAPWAWYLGFALVSLFAAVRVITHTRPVYSALYFVLLVVAVAGLLLMMQVELLAYALIIVYAGAILVTYLFVIMLAQQPHPADYDVTARDPFWGCLAGFFLLALIGSRLVGSATGVLLPEPPPPGDNFTLVGTRLLTEYMLAIQVVGVLLTAAMVGAIAIARREKPAETDAVEGEA
ncbi:MAG: NADH-quinone oxidoreductase subunit J [Phycisphaerales bacterium]|nr:NADH-quinone oxidoreductase subunit J [Phycisphaerales bacterium]